MDDLTGVAQDAETLLEVLADNDRRGWSTQFVARAEAAIECQDCHNSFAAAETSVLELKRLEGASDPERLAPLQAARRKIVDIVASVIDDLNVPRPDISAIVLTGMIRQVLRFLPKPWPEDLPDLVADQFLFGQMSRKKRLVR